MTFADRVKMFVMLVMLWLSVVMCAALLTIMVMAMLE